MRIRRLIVGLLICLGMVVFFFEHAQAQAPAAKVHGTLAQVMRGVLFPNANVFYFAQGDNPADVKHDDDDSLATNPLASAYGGWEAVENSAVALAESANLLTIPGRKCSNGRDVPLRNADWVKFVQDLRDAGMTAFKAAQSKKQENILEASDAVTTACSNCHEKYRDVTVRCM
jgi:hypothetical protein